MSTRGLPDLSWPQENNKQISATELNKRAFFIAKLPMYLKKINLRVIKGMKERFFRKGMFAYMSICHPCK